MKRNPPDRFFSAFAGGRKKQAPGLIQTARQRRVAKMIRRTRAKAGKHRYEWIDELGGEGLAPGQNPRRRRRRNDEQLPLLWRRYSFMGTTIEEQGRGRWKVYIPGHGSSPTLTSKRAAERWAKVYGGSRNPMRKRKNLFGFGRQKTRRWTVKKQPWGYTVLHGSKPIDEFKTKREADDFVKWAREKDRTMKANPRRKTRRVKQTTRRVKRNSARTRRRKTARRRNRKITFPVPVTPQQRKKLSRWLKTNFGKRIRVK